MARFIFLTALIAVGCACATNARADLVAYYEGEGNANDSAGAHHGTLMNNAGFGTGIIGQAFNLNGTNQFISVPDSPNWAFGSNPFTLSLWVNFDSIRQGGLGTLPNVFIAQDEGAGTTNKWVFYYDGLGHLAFHINGPGLAFLTPPTLFTPAVGDWHLYSLNRSGSSYTFYADGVSLGTASSALVIPNANAALTISQAEGTGFVDGRLDDVRLYDRALSGPELVSLATIPEPSSIVLVSMVAFLLLAYGFRRWSAAPGPLA